MVEGKRRRRRRNDDIKVQNENDNEDEDEDEDEEGGRGRGARWRQGGLFLVFLGSWLLAVSSHFVSSGGGERGSVIFFVLNR